MDNHFDFLSYFSSYTISISENGDYAEIQNPFGNDNMIIIYTPDSLPYTAIFPFYHCHFESADETIEFVDRFISGRSVCFARAHHGNITWSTEIATERLKDLSIKTIEQICNPSGKLKPSFRFTDSVHIRGWHPKDNFDGMILRDARGNWFLQKSGSVHD